jgi:hypothetical protein
MEQNESRRIGGGAATQGGVNYQNRVAAWVCANILAERPAAPIGPDGVAEYARFETSEPVDDLLVGSVDGRHAFVQAKRTLTLSSATDSEFASVIDQFVRQYLSARGLSSARPWARALDPNKDRLVLATTSESSQPLRRDLAAILNRVRNLTAGQPLTDAATNAAQSEGFETLVAQVRRCWHVVTGEDATDADLRALLTLTHVCVLDVEADGVAEREALSLLETRVLAPTGQSRAAWSTMLQLVADLSQRRSGADQAGLRAAIERAGINLKSPPQYEKDIATLKNQAKETVQYLAHNSQIPAGGTAIRVSRHATEALRSASELNSLVVVGWPGAGKSGVLHDFAESRINEGRDVVFIAVDQIAARSLGELRNEIGIDHEVLDVLLNWPGEHKGLIVIDALDAARGDPAGTALLSLMRAIGKAGTRWQVVASIRKYDLRYNPGLRELFRGSLAPAIGPDLQDSEFANLRHLNVPLFTDEEMDEVRRQAPSLELLLQIAPQALQDLLRVPFNLRLMADILESGVDVRELRPIRTQSELLNRYWAYRVGGAGGDLRERIIRRTCEHMIHARRLRAERPSLVEPGAAAALEELFSNQVLVEWQPSGASAPQRQVVAFSHHILFDFAVSQLFLPPEPDEVVRLIAADPDLVVMIRPSIVMLYQHLWEADRGAFWALLFRICGETPIPNIGKVIGAAVAAESGRTIQDFDPLEQALGSPGATRAAAETVFRHLIGALTAGPATAFAGPNAGPYCELLRVLTQAPTELIAGYGQTLLRAVLEHRSSLTEDQFSDAGAAARNLLAFAWRQEKRSSWLVTNALRSVCNTFRSDPTASAALLRRSIEPTHLATYGYEEAQWLVRDLKEISVCDPEFVADVYVAVFGHDEPSTESTDISGSRILALTSNRRQDYKHSKWQLAQDYPHLVRLAPLPATRAMIGVVDAYVRNKHRDSSGPAIDTFDLNGKLASAETDYSYIWDHGSSHDDDELTILNIFFRHLEELAQHAENGEILDGIIAILLCDAKQAVIWARLLRLGALHPSEFGTKLRPLAWATPLLRAVDTESDAGDFVSAIFPRLSIEERGKVERAILSLADVTEDSHRRASERDRACLLGRLSPTDLVTPEAKHLLDELATANAIPEPARRHPGFQVSAVDFDERMFVENVLGVSAEPESHEKFLDVNRPVQEFQTRHTNNAPSLAEADAALPSLEALRATLGSSGNDVDPKLIVMGCGTLAAACECIARVEQLPPSAPLGQFVQSVLLEMSRHPAPEHNPDHDASFDKHPSWGAPIARIEAAQGLIFLARQTSYCSSDVLEAIQRIGRDPAPEVRFQIASHITCLYETAQEQMWSFLEDRSQTETSSAVLDSLARCLNRMTGHHPDRVAELSKRIFDRVLESAGSENPRATCLHTFVALHIWLSHGLARQILYGLTKEVQTRARDLQVVLSSLRGPLTHGVTGTAIAADSGVRTRAIELFHAIATSACDAFTSLLAQSQTEEWPESATEVLRGVAHLVDHCASELYFASGVFSGGQNEEKRITFEEQERFYRELTPTIDRLSTIGLASMVHHLVEMLELFVPLDPRRVFLQVSALVESGRRDNYQYESLATEHIVRIVARYLAEYRSLLQEDAECRTALRKTLDIFVAAGWPAAQQLSYRLDEIFR